MFSVTSQLFHFSSLVAVGFAFESDEGSGRYALRGEPDLPLLEEAASRLQRLHVEYARRAEVRAEEAARSLATLRLVSKGNRESKDAKAQAERAAILSLFKADRALLEGK